MLTFAKVHSSKIRRDFGNWQINKKEIGIESPLFPIYNFFCKLVSSYRKKEVRLSGNEDFELNHYLCQSINCMMPVRLNDSRLDNHSARAWKPQKAIQIYYNELYSTLWPFFLSLEARLCVTFPKAILCRFYHSYNE